MKKVKLIFYKIDEKGHKNLYLLNDTITLRTIPYKGTDPIDDINSELKLLNIIGELNIKYLGVILNTSVLSVELPQDFDISCMYLIDMYTFLEDSALVNLEDNSAMSLFIINNLSTKIIKES